MKINSCAFCGGKICRPDSDFKGSWVLCFGCLARGPRANTAEEAVEKWNTLGDQWVGVEDRLPEELESVIGYGNYHDGGDLHGEVFFSMDEWMSVRTEPEFKGVNVTHWMPLPEPPKGVE